MGESRKTIYQRRYRAKKRGLPLPLLPVGSRLLKDFFDDAAPFKIEGVYCKLIPLTRGQFSIVDVDDYSYISEQTWHAKWDEKLRGFYAARTSVKADGEIGHAIFMHRDILGLARLDPIRVDHSNHCGLDNRRNNIRLATPTQNCHNRLCYSSNDLGIKGVSFWVHSTTGVGKFRARICVNKKSIWLGYFATAELARGAYSEAAEKYFGEFARTT